MSLAIVYSRALSGIDAPLVTVETDLSFGLPKFSIVGLPETAVKESRDRVRSALLNTHFEFPISHITVNLAPADLPKEGGRFDLPIAIGILAASSQIPLNILDEYEIVGELALSGELRAVQGILPFALNTKKVRKKLIVPLANADEAAIVSDLMVFPAQHILDVSAHLCSQKKILSYKKTFSRIENKTTGDFSDVNGQDHAKRALEIAASGGHSVLLIGPPGTGKTMLASRLPSILPDMTEQEAIESAAVMSITSKGFNFTDFKKRPFRSPHHSASAVALVGGSNPPKPGEISLAHQGILFLDELSEFNRHVLEALREPLESGMITISRAAFQCAFPANFQLIAAMNPCPCGYYGDEEHTCRCTSDQIQKYRLKISGPILDRIDMHINVPRLSPELLSLKNNQNNEKSADIKERVKHANVIQLKRFNKLNTKLTPKELQQVCHLNNEQEDFLNHAIKKLKLSARSYHRILKIALTIADLENASELKIEHLCEALSFRKID